MKEDIEFFIFYSATMRKSCVGCAHYRKLSTGRGNQHICHYAIDRDVLREIPADRCPYYTTEWKRSRRRRAVNRDEL